MLPHYNSKAIVVLVVNQGRGSIELVGIREQQQQEEEEEEEEEEGNRQVRGYTARLSEGDIAVIPAAYPVAINASSNLHLLGFGINAENNQRFFLAGMNIYNNSIELNILFLRFNYEMFNMTSA